MNYYYQLIFEVAEIGGAQRCAFYIHSKEELSKEQLTETATQIMNKNKNTTIEYIATYPISKSHYFELMDAKKSN